MNNARRAVDCKVYKCNKQTGNCGLENAPYMQACNTDLCLENQRCDVDGQCKEGTPKECTDFPGAAGCCVGEYDSATGECSYSLKQGAECGKDADCGGSRTCNTGVCKCEGTGGGECGIICDENFNCIPDPPGTTFVPIEGCDDWEDADKATGWHSVVEGSGNDPD